MIPVQEIETERYFPAPWQEEDLSYLITRNYSANWSEMGCYKTTTALWMVERSIEARGLENANVLIVTTKSGKGTYFDAIPKSFSDYDSRWRVFNANTKEIDLVQYQFHFKLDLDPVVEKLINPNRRQITVAHYHVFTNKSAVKDILKKIKWDFIILDEAHRIKDKTTQWTRNLKQLEGEYRSVMTGTGFINNPAEIWSLLNFLDRRTFGSYWRFRRHFCLEENWSGFNKIVGINPATKDEFRELRTSLGPRRMMLEVHENINEPIFTPYEVELNPTQRKMYNEILKELRTLDKNNVPIHSPNVLSQLNRLRQITVATPELIETYYDEKQDRRVQVVKLTEPSSKLDTMMEIIEGLEWDDENKQQVVVFSNFKDPIELAKVRLDKANIPFIHMKQSDNDQIRYEKWHDIFPRKEHQVFLSTLQLGSESINLSSAHYAIFLDRSWSPKDNNQGVARLYRPGQTGTANIIHINANRTTDKRIKDLNDLKTGWFEEIFGDEEA